MSKEHPHDLAIRGIRRQLATARRRLEELKEARSVDPAGDFDGEIRRLNDRVETISAFADLLEKSIASGGAFRIRTAQGLN